jgi:hypothetical protein
MYDIYLRHPRHGTKVAISEMEARGDEENGWVRYNPDTPSDDDAAPVVNELEVRRRGRPPKQQQG